jgi:hypothetical protein
MCKCATVDEAARFESEVAIAPRVADKTRWCANLRIRCADCKTEFRFDALPRGVLHGTKPATPGHIGYGAVLPISRLSDSEQRIITTFDPWESDVRAVRQARSAEEPAQPATSET